MNYADTTFTDPRAAEARRLRMEEGLSSAEIRERLNVEKSQLRYWLAGLPANDESLRARAKDDQKDAARELRRQGKTYNQIVAELGCAKSSVSLWVRDIEVVRDVHPSWTPEARAKREVRKQERHRDKIAARFERREDAAERYGEFSLRELQIAGVIAYWCEGAKWKDWQTSVPQVQFINSDPALIRLFLRFMETAPVDHGTISYRLHIHERADEASIKRFWMRELGIGADDFRSTVWKRHNPKTVRKNVGDHYHGCLCVAVCKSRELYLYMDGLVGAALAGVAPRP